MARILVASLIGFGGLMMILFMAALCSSPEPAEPTVVPAKAPETKQLIAAPAKPETDAQTLCIHWARERAPGAAWRGILGIEAQTIGRSHIQVTVQGDLGDQRLRTTCQVSLDGAKLTWALIRRVDSITLEPYGPAIAELD